VYDKNASYWFNPLGVIRHEIRKSGRYDDVLLVLKKTRPLKLIPFVRNLLYHIYPIKESLWHWNIQRIRNFWHVFTGRKIMMIVTDERTDDPNVVLKELGHPVESYVQRNEARLGEVKTFQIGLSKLQSLKPNEATFYAHAKGVTHNGQRRSNVLAWADALYNLNLSTPMAIDVLLNSYATVGALKKTGSITTGSDWYFEGTFFWFKHSEIFKRNWKNIQQRGHGIEGYPGNQFRSNEAFSLWDKSGSKYQSKIKLAEYESALVFQKNMANWAIQHGIMG